MLDWRYLSTHDGENFLMRLAKSVNINWRGLLAVGHDCLTVAIIWVFAYLLRFNFEIPEQFRSGMWQSLVWIVPLFGVV